MGFKTKSKETNQTNICNHFKIGGLIFDSKYDYHLFKDIDKNIHQKAKLVEDGIIDLEELFNNIKKINVKENYYDSFEEMYGLFKNATELLCYEGTRFVKSYEVGRYFFDKINIIDSCDSD